MSGCSFRSPACRRDMVRGASIRAWVIVCWLALSGVSGPVAAHHGGIGIEGD